MKRHLRLATDEDADDLMDAVAKAAPWPLMNRYALIASAWPDLSHEQLALMAKYPYEIQTRRGAWVLPESWAEILK